MAEIGFYISSAVCVLGMIVMFVMGLTGATKKQARPVLWTVAAASIVMVICVYFMGLMVKPHV